MLAATGIKSRKMADAFHPVDYRGYISWKTSNPVVPAPIGPYGRHGKCRTTFVAGTAHRA